MRISVYFLGILLALGTRSANAQVTRAAARAARQALAADARALLKKDFLRDAASTVKRLKKSRMVFRFTNPQRAFLESRKGLAPGTHMTVGAGPGRPLSGKSAAAKFGLPRVPSVRELIELPRGTAIRVNKALKGWQGVGEITSPALVAGKVIRKIVLLRP